MFQKQKLIVSNKLRQSAKGQSCSVRLPGVCNHDPETTVLAHLGGGGMGTKQPDLFGAFCCASCHDHVDGRVKRAFEQEFLNNAFYDGMVRTQLYWLQFGYISINK